MRTKLGETHSRGCGAVDPRISNAVRQQNSSNIPLIVGTPVVWIDPDVISMVAGTTQPTFTDRMGISWSAQASRVGLMQCPGAFNGRNGLMSSALASTTGMQSATWVAAANITIFWVYRGHASTNRNPGAKNGMIGIWKGINATPSQDFYFHHGNSTQRMTFVYGTDANGTKNYQMATEVGTPYIFAARGSAASMSLYANGVIGQAEAAPTAAIANAASAMYIGEYPLTTEYTQECMFGDVIVYNSYLSDADRNAVEKYLGRKYGVIVA
jgi:hypothetical protein